MGTAPENRRAAKRSGYNQSMSTAALDVLPVGQRNRIPMAAIEDVVGQIAARFQPRQIILFGSYAAGQPRPDSDVDLMVVMDTQLSGAQQVVKILTSINYRFGLDLLVYTPERLAQRVALGDPFVNEILQLGRVMYESTGA